MNGNISNKVIGAFKNVKKYGYKIFVFKFLKKEISSNIPNIIIKQKKIRLIFKNLIRKFPIIYF